MPTANKQAPVLLTVRTLCEYFDTEPHRVNYAVKSRGIKPKIIAGKTRIFAADDLEAIERALAETASYNATDRDEDEVPRV